MEVDDSSSDQLTRQFPCRTPRVVPLTRPERPTQPESSRPERTTYRAVERHRYLGCLEPGAPRYNDRREGREQRTPYTLEVQRLF